MLLKRLKYWRVQRGYSVSELAAKSGVDPSAISLYEDQKRSAHDITVSRLAAALEVNKIDLHWFGPRQPSTAMLLKKTQPTTVEPTSNANKTQTSKKNKSGLPPRTKLNTNVFSYWVVEKNQQGDELFNFNTKAEAERLQARLGGKSKARIYGARSSSDVWEQHRQFLIRVTTGHDAW